MQPEVIAWALLFVVVFSVVYRFVAWIGKRFGAKPPREIVTTDTKAESRASPVYLSVPVGAAAFPPSRTAPARAPPPAPVVTPEPAALDPIEASTGEASTGEDVVLDREPPPLPETERDILRAPEADGPAQSVAQPVRTALAPSVAATLPPRLPLKASLAATISPAAPLEARPAVTDVGGEAEAVHPETIDMAPTPAEDVSNSEVSEDALPVEPTRLDQTRPARTVRLRARRIGAETVRLDVRLRDSRERRIRRMPRTTRKPLPPGVKQGLRVLVPKTPAKKTPTRRIVRNAGDAIVLSSKGQMKIIGASQRSFRVLPVPVV